MAALLPLSYLSCSFFLGLIALNISQSRRPILLLPLTAFAILAFQRMTDIVSDPDHASILGLFVLIYISHMFHVLCVEKYVLPETTSCWNWRAACKMLFNARWIGTAKPAPGVPKHSTFLPPLKNEGGTDLASLTASPKIPIPSQRRTFLLKRLFSLLTICALHNIYWQLLLAPHPHLFHPITHSDFLPPKETYLRRLPTVTTRETLIRSVMVFHFVWSAWSVLTGMHDLLALVFIGVGLDDADAWPPLYGNASEMYTIRRFWGKFWHRLVYRAYTTFGALLSQKILRLRRGSMADRLVVNFSVFALSGVVHALVTAQLGFRCGYWEDVMWFCLNFAALIGEEGVQCGVERLWKKSRKMSRIFGYVWVFGFFFWSLPKTMYSKIQCGMA